MEGNSVPSSWSDRELVVAFKSGDEEAYDEIYRRHSGMVRAVCARRLTHSYDTEEAVQETFLRAFQALPRFNSDYRLGAWLNRIAINVCIDELRSRSRSAITRPIDENDGAAEQGPDELIASQRPEVMAALRELKPLHADALRLQAVHGLSHQELAAQLRISPAQVKSLLHRARLAFKRVLRDASGFFLAPVAAFRRTRRNAQAMGGSSNGVLNAMGAATAVQVSLPAAERLLTGAVVAVLALGGTSHTTPPEESERTVRATRLETKLDVAPKKPVVRTSPERASREPAAPRVAKPDDEATVVPVSELPIDVPGVQSVVDPVSETVTRELNTHATNTKNNSNLETPALVDPEEIPHQVEEAAGDAQQTAVDLTDGSFRK